MSQSHYFSPQTLVSDEPLTRSSPRAVFARGHSLQFLTGDGVFSKSGLDAGSRILIDAILVSPNAIFCDLGCGWGAVGAFVAREFSGVQIYAVDVNARAVQLARHNFRLNQIGDAALWCGDGLSATRSDFFDTIACNPPIRAGNTVIEKLFEDAHRGLKIGGELWVVIRTAQGAKSWQKKLAARFGECETAIMKNGYRVLKAVRVG